MSIPSEYLTKEEFLKASKHLLGMCNSLKAMSDALEQQLIILDRRLDRLEKLERKNNHDR